MSLAKTIEEAPAAYGDFMFMVNTLKNQTAIAVEERGEDRRVYGLPFLHAKNEAFQPLACLKQLCDTVGDDWKVYIGYPDTKEGALCPQMYLAGFVGYGDYSVYEVIRTWEASGELVVKVHDIKCGIG